MDYSNSKTTTEIGVNMSLLSHSLSTPLVRFRFEVCQVSVYVIRRRRTRSLTTHCFEGGRPPPRPRDVSEGFGTVVHARTRMWTQQKAGTATSRN
jgi:hypothetical protein